MKSLTISTEKLNKVLSYDKSYGDTRDLNYKDESFTPLASITTFVRLFNSFPTVTNYTQRIIASVVEKIIKFVHVCHNCDNKGRTRSNCRFLLISTNFNNSFYALNFKINYHNPNMHVTSSLMMNEKSKGKSKSIPIITKLVES